jgi:adenine-specific DNA-methyltransferase
MPFLQFKGKSFVQNHHLAVPYHQLVPQKDKSLSEKVSLHDNLIVQGDNLIALKALLPTYAGKVDCIYIDPPYNTGNEGWAYNDNVNSPLIKQWLKDKHPVDKEDLTRHDKWLCMMMPRLKLLKELLSEDGLIFISIDDNEQHHLKLLMDEVFGELNFIANITVLANPRGRQSDKSIAQVHDYGVIYAKDKSKAVISGTALTAERIAEYNKVDDEGKPWRELGLRQRGSASRREDRPDMYFPIYVDPKTGKVSLEESPTFTTPVYPRKSDGSDSRWMWGKEKVSRDSERLIYARKVSTRNEYDIFIRDYMHRDGEERTTKSSTLWADKSVNTELGGKELKEILGESVFDYPKPVGLIKHFLKIATSKDSLVLDSFAGSGTTAQAVLELNKEDDGDRKFILVEMESYANSVTAERVRRVIKGVPTIKNELIKDGLGDTFSYFELGNPIETEGILKGSKLPSYLELARYVYYTSTGEEFNESKLDESKNFVGSSSHYDVFMLYKPDIEYLKQTALTLNLARELRDKAGSRPLLVFAPTKYVESGELDELKIDFCQLPFEIYKVAK